MLCATDNNYAPYCGIMLTSLFESNRDCVFLVFIFVDATLSESNQKKFKKLEERYGCKINLQTIDNRQINSCPLNCQRNIDNHRWVSKPTYYRLLAAELLPKYVKKILYLDCDIAVVGDVKPFWRIEMIGKALTGVVDCDGENNRKRMEIVLPGKYFNAGVALYNLEYWRENHITDRFFSYIRQHQGELLLMDQDLMNGVLFDEVQWVPERFNFQVAFFEKSFWGDYSEEFRHTLLSENKEVVIIHYVGSTKPWDYRYYGSPYYLVWNIYRKKSFWRRSHITHPLSVYVKFQIKKIFWSKSLKQKRQMLWSVLQENEFCYK